MGVEKNSRGFQAEVALTAQECFIKGCSPGRLLGLQ